MTPQLVLNYLKGLTNSYIIHKVSRFEIGGLRIFEIGEKYYFEDLGIRNHLFGTSISSDIHKIMETDAQNATYLRIPAAQGSVIGHVTITLYHDDKHTVLCQPKHKEAYSLQHWTQSGKLDRATMGAILRTMRDIATNPKHPACATVRKTLDKLNPLDLSVPEAHLH